MKNTGDLKVILGQIVRHERIGKGWTQQQLANACSLKRTTVSNIEAGRQALTVEQFCLIMDVLQKSPAKALELALGRLDQAGRQYKVEKVVTSTLEEETIQKHVLDALR